MSVSSAGSPYDSLNTIDNSINKAVFYFILSAITWLVLSSLLGLIGGIKTVIPSFLSTNEGFTFGRIQAMLNTTLLMGWCSNAIFAVAFWIMARLSSTPIKHGGILLIAGVIWNIALSLALIGIFIGDLTAYSWMEFPSYTSGIFLLAYTLIAVWGIVTYRHKQNDYSYVSQWYILGGLLWFPWIFVIGQFFINWVPVRGVLQSIVHAWYINNVFYLWLCPIALGACYYFIPKLSNTAIRSYHLSALAFWTFVLFASWSGLTYLIGGPVPVWLTTTSIVFAVSLIIPALIFYTNLIGTALSNFSQFKNNLALKFIIFGSAAFILHLFVKMGLSIRSVDALAHFTMIYEAHHWHLIYGFFSMVFFGAFYYLVPTLLKHSYKSNVLPNFNFVLSALGIIILLVALYGAGWQQGAQFANAELSFLQIANDLTFWIQLKLVGLTILFVANLLFAFNVVALLLSKLLDVLPNFSNDEINPNT
jgi:cytochrome c oxidase cbb3-type subunit 1